MGDYYGIQGGSGAAAGTGADQQFIFKEIAGPSSYATGGFTVDVSTWLASLNDVDLTVKKGSRGALPAVDYHVTLNSPTDGIATVKLMRRRYDKTTAIGGVTNQPSGVTLQSSSGQTTSSESAHTHAIDHDHASFSSGGNSTGGAHVRGSTGPDLDGHTHSLNLPALTGTSGAGTSHNHVDNSIYEHGHDVTRTETNLAWVEVANATNLSTTIWYLKAVGVSV